MSKHASPLLGYNNNVRHKNRVFHIQTEDSGVKHPHIITHLFMDGGRILKSVKRSYAEHVGAEKMHETVKQMMKEQHKAMFIALRDGQFDHLLGDDAAKDKKDEGPAAAKEAPKEAAKPEAPPPVSAKEPPPAPAAVKTRTEPAPPPSAAERDDVEMEPMTTRTPELTLDIGALERAAASQPSGIRPASDLPPPPANMFREKPASGGYRAAPVAEPAKRGSVPPGKKPPSSPPKKPASSPPPRGNKPPSEGRYAAARPAAIFGQAKPQQGTSIFGEDLISDKSLDEVILSYLAEDLEPTKK